MEAIYNKVEKYLQDDAKGLNQLFVNVLYGKCYLTYEQIEELVLPYIELLEQYKEVFPENVGCWYSLWYLYYLSEEYETCLAIRKQLYEITGDEQYSIEGYVMNYEYGEVTYDKYRRSIKQIAPDGRILKETRESYDESEKIVSVSVLTYEYNEQGCKLHLYYEDFDGALGIVEADLDII